MNEKHPALEKIHSAQSEAVLRGLYGEDPKELSLARARFEELIEGFQAHYGAGRAFRFFSAPGRTEIGGNHTDHNHGRVLAGAVNLDILAAAAPNDEGVVRLKSAEYDKIDVIDLSDLSIRDEEAETSASLIRGVCKKLTELGYRIGGFDAYTNSRVLKGSGLSSSAAFENLVLTVFNHLYNDGAVPAVEAAKICQFAENVYFKKPSGLMDQMASCVGGFIAIDFLDPQNPVIEQIPFDFSKSGHALCIVDTGGSHSDLTGDYAAVPQEMKAVAAALGHEVLRDCDRADFEARIGELRAGLGDRAVLRAIHFFADNERVRQQTEALSSGDFERFKQLSIESGYSSYMYLQNVFACSTPKEQGLSLALALSEEILRGKGAWRVHGGGFAGTIQAFVPFECLEEYRKKLEAVFGEGTCHVLFIRPSGGVEVSF